MQTSKPYNRVHAEALLAPCDGVNAWVIDDRGVWPTFNDYKEADRLGFIPEFKELAWKPVMAFKDDQNAPDCVSTPALPFPFDARDLAAFMLDGAGYFVAGYYGNWEDGLEAESLGDIDPSNNYARRAVREAFDAYREAKRAIGCPDGESPDTDAMARELLKPTPPEQPQAAAPAPVVAETPQERRARWLAMFEEEEARAPRGALQRLADREGVDRSNMRKDIDKARAARDEKRRAGGWASQLVQDGKRKH